jgi:hypothetical protein
VPHFSPFMRRRYPFELRQAPGRVR